MEIGTVRPGRADAPPSDSPWFISPEQRIARYPRFPSPGPVQERKDRENCQKLNESQTNLPLDALLGGLLGPSWASWGPLGLSWRPVGPSCEALAVMGPSWGSLGPSWWPLGRLLGLSWEPLGALLGRLGAILGASWADLGRREAEKARTPKTFKKHRKLISFASFALLRSLLEASWGVLEAS